MTIADWKENEARVKKELAANPIRKIVCGQCEGLMVGYGENGLGCTRCGALVRRDV